MPGVRTKKRAAAYRAIHSMLYTFVCDKIQMARKGGLLTSRGTKLLLTPASLGTSGSVDTAKMAFEPRPSQTRKGGKGRKGRKGKGRKTRRRR